MKHLFLLPFLCLITLPFTLLSQDTLFQVTGNNDHPITQILNEGDGGSIRILPLPGMPPQTTNKLYNAAGSLFFGDNVLGNLWSLNGLTTYYSGGNVGIGLSDPDASLGVLGGIAVGALSTNQVESGRLAFDEDLNFAGICGFEFAYDGLTNLLSLNAGCPVTANGPAMVVRRNSGRFSFPNRIRIGDEEDAAADLHIKCSDSPFPDPTTGGIILENAVNANRWQQWNSSPYLSFAYQGTRVAYIHTNGGYVEISDRRMKEDITDLDDVLGKVRQLKPVSYRFRHLAQSSHKSIGFIAQDAMEFFPETVHTEDGSQYGISYNDYSVISIKAIQELSELLDEKEREMESLRSQLSRQQAVMNNLQAEQENMKSELQQLKALLEE